MKSKIQMTQSKYTGDRRKFVELAEFVEFGGAI